uniref:Uncharacterized protein n=1 Tax=Avena sativa TaxID=4498 RepID=A0ACD5YAN1_AVESA
MESSTTTQQANANGENERKSMAELAERILLLATLVATVTYAAAFNTPGGVWQDTAGGHLPGDPIIRSTQYVRYLMFFYCNATAFAASLMVFVLLLLLLSVRRQENLRMIVILLVLVMLLGLLSLIGAYTAGTFRDPFTAVYTSLLVVAVFTYVGIQRVRAPASPESDVKGASGSLSGERLREMLMQLAAFALTVTYVGGLSTPGGFWDSTEDGHRPGDAIIKGARLTAFFVCNTTAFVASLLIVVVLLVRRISQTIAAFLGSMVMLFGLLGSYLAGSHWEKAVFFASLIGAILAYIVFQVFVVRIAVEVIRRWAGDNNFWAKLQDFQGLFQAFSKLQRKLKMIGNFFKATNTTVPVFLPPLQTIKPSYIFQSAIKHGFSSIYREKEEEVEQNYSSYIQYLAALALTITYQAGLDPPGGLWQENGDGHKAGDPILRTTNPRRYNGFFYCNSVAFVASLVCIILVQIRPLLQHRALEQAMILDLLSLVAAYAIGSCRDETTTVYAMGIGGAALVYVVLHVVLLDQTDIHDQRKVEDDVPLNSMGYGLFLFALLVATITYQAGLTPPGGFLLKDDESRHHAGDPVLLYNYPRRYSVFFYCNSTSFMVSIAIIILLVNPNIYKPAMRTHALSICTAVSFFCLLAAFAAGTSQHLKTSIYVLVLLAVVLVLALLLLLAFFLRSVIFPAPSPSPELASDADTEPVHRVDEHVAISDEHIATSTAEYDQARVKWRKETRAQANRMYLMTVGILVASVTYQAGLDPPGGSWQRSGDGHNAGESVMQDNRRRRYQAFFYANSTSFVTLIFLMLMWLMLARSSLKQSKPLSRVMYTMIVLDFLGLLGAYAAGSGREWKTSVDVVVIVLSVLVYFSVHVLLPLLRQEEGGQQDTDAAAPTAVGN